MWRIDSEEDKNKIFFDLVVACKSSVPGSPLSLYLMYNLEKYPLNIRREIVNRVKAGCSPLFIACKKGQTEIVEYLIANCDADIEQRGLYEVVDDSSTHVVTPLWCAAASGNLSVVEILLRHSADINAVSNTGSTPVRFACLVDDFQMVKYLVEHGADINRPNYDGSTCLICSVGSVEMCDFLIKHGADVNARDIENKTALHYAIQKESLETTKLLIEKGADYNTKSRHGDDALQTASITGTVSIFDYLILKICYPSEKLANAYELMGATLYNDDEAVVLHYWRQGLACRQRHGLLPKRPIQLPREEYRNQKEFENMEELDNIATDHDLISRQCLIIVERILGPHHEKTLSRLMFAGLLPYSYWDVTYDMLWYQRSTEMWQQAALDDTYDMFWYQESTDFWRRALEISVEKDSILHIETCLNAQTLVSHMVGYIKYIDPRNEQDAKQRFHDVVSTFKLITKDILDVRQLLTLRPVDKRQLGVFDKILICVIHLMYLMTETAKTSEQIQTVVFLATNFVRTDPRSVLTNDSLLHLCVSKCNTISSRYFHDMDDTNSVIYTKPNVTKLLLECGADVNAKNKHGFAPLHIATEPENCSVWLLKLLLQYGAHLDQPDASGVCPLGYVADVFKRSDVDICLFNYVNLKCLCASVISKYQIPYKNRIPKALECFVKLHEPWLLWVSLDMDTTLWTNVTNRNDEVVITLPNPMLLTVKYLFSLSV